MKDDFNEEEHARKCEELTNLIQDLSHKLLAASKCFNIMSIAMAEIKEKLEFMKELETPLEKRLEKVEEIINESLEETSDIMWDESLAQYKDAGIVFPNKKFDVMDEELLDSLPTLEEGDEVICPLCSETHIAKYGFNEEGLKSNDIISVECEKHEIAVVIGAQGRLITQFFDGTEML